MRTSLPGILVEWLHGAVTVGVPEPDVIASGAKQPCQTTVPNNRAGQPCWTTDDASSIPPTLHLGVADEIGSSVCEPRAKLIERSNQYGDELGSNRNTAEMWLIHVKLPVHRPR